MSDIKYDQPRITIEGLKTLLLETEGRIIAFEESSYNNAQDMKAKLNVLRAQYRRMCVLAGIEP